MQLSRRLFYGSEPSDEGHAARVTLRGLVDAFVHQDAGIMHMCHSPCRS